MWYVSVGVVRVHLTNVVHSFSNTKHDYTSYFVCHTVRAGALVDLKYTAFFHAHLLHKRNQLLSRAFILNVCRLFCVYSSLEPSHICSAQKKRLDLIQETREKFEEWWKCKFGRLV